MTSFSDRQFFVRDHLAYHSLPYHGIIPERALLSISFRTSYIFCYISGGKRLLEAVPPRHP